MAENNHQRALPLRAPRGVLFDRDGRCWSRTATRAASPSFASTRKTSTARCPCWPRCSDSRNRPSATSSSGTGASRHAGRSPSCRMRRWRRSRRWLRGVSIRVAGRRRRTGADAAVSSTLASHLFGYVGEVTDAQVANAEELRSGDVVAGLEKTYNPLLMGQDGARRVVVNSTGREIRTLEEVQPSEGTRLQLTIDYDVQKAVEDAFAASGFNGAAVILDAMTAVCWRLQSDAAVRPERVCGGHRPQRGRS